MPGYAESIELPRYLAVGLNKVQKADRLLLIVFSSDAPPNLLQEDGLCGSFVYFKKATGSLIPNLFNQ
jgi:hypothetical protein